MASEHINEEALKFIEALPATTAERLTAAAPSADPRHEDTAAQQAIEQLYPDVNLRRLLPTADDQRIRARVKADLRDGWETNELYALGDLVHNPAHAETIAQVEAAAMRPPSARATWMGRHKLSSTNGTDALLIHVLDLGLTNRAEASLKTAPPSRVLAAYVGADDETGAVRRWIEQTHADGWKGVTSEDPREAQAATHLRAAIERERQGRIPPAVHAARQAIGTAADFLRRVEVTRGLRPRRREQ